MAMQARQWVVRDRALDLSRVLWMGIVNATPDSFSDGGETLAPEDAARKAARLVADGADIIDLGAESTRPGAPFVTEEEEERRLLPALEAVRRAVSVPISVDTRRAAIARKALSLGAEIVNDVSALGDPAMAAVVADTGAGLVLMHGYGEHLAHPAGDPDAPCSIAGVIRFLAERAARAARAGVRREAIAVDPGIGFGKSNAESAAILRATGELAGLGFPVLVGLSRKRFLSDLPEVAGAKDRDEATCRALRLAMDCGANILRVHACPPPQIRQHRPGVQAPARSGILSGKEP